MPTSSPPPVRLDPPASPALAAVPAPYPGAPRDAGLPQPAPTAGLPIDREPATLAGTFEHVLRRTADARVTAGNAVRLLHDGPATFDGMFELIAGARQSVALESYIVRSDVVGLEMAAALRDAARRGARVRLLTDAIGARGFGRTVARELTAAGVEVRFFNRPGLRRPWLGLLPRDHRKLLVVDDSVGIVGGVGIGHEWRPRADVPPGVRWRDTSVRIEGPAGGDMALAFADMWQRAGGRSASGPAGAAATVPTPPTSPGAGLRDATALVGIVAGMPWRFRLARALHVQTVFARRAIWIADGYFLPSSAEVEAMLGAARDGVDVRLLVPSRNDHPWIIRLTRRYYPRLLAGGIRIWEWAGAMMHAKTTVIDGQVTRVGSTDANLLGTAINYELDAVVSDRALGIAASEMFLEDLALSREIRIAARRAR